MTYIPKQTKLNKERVEAKLEAGLVRRLERYCQFLESDRDYVISQMLEIAFRKDKAFAEWLAHEEASPSTPLPVTRRAKGAPAPVAAETGE